MAKSRKNISRRQIADILPNQGRYEPREESGPPSRSEHRRQVNPQQEPESQWGIAHFRWSLLHQFDTESGEMYVYASGLDHATADAIFQAYNAGPPQGPVMNEAALAAGFGDQDQLDSDRLARDLGVPGCHIEMDNDEEEGDPAEIRVFSPNPLSNLPSSLTITPPHGEGHSPMTSSRKTAALDRIADRLQGMARRIPLEKKTLYVLAARLDRVSNQIDHSAKKTRFPGRESRRTV